MKENGRTPLLSRVPWKVSVLPFHTEYGTFLVHQDG